MTRPAAGAAEENGPRAERLKVHVLNVGKGDSILIEFPEGIWGVVDCNRSRKDDPIPAVEFLAAAAERGEVEEIAFVALTHPHHDHFKGMAALVEAWQGKINHFWLFTFQGTCARLRWLIRPKRACAEWMQEWMDGRLDGWMSGWVDGSMRGSNPPFLHSSTHPAIHSSTHPPIHLRRQSRPPSEPRGSTLECEEPHFWDFGLKAKPIARYFYLSWVDEEHRWQADEFSDLYLLVKSLRGQRRHQMPPFYNDFSDFKRMPAVRLPASVEVWSLSPFGEYKQRYVDRISAYRGEDLPEHPPGEKDLEHQLLSSVLLIRFYDAFVLLGSDADKGVWKVILNDTRGAMLREPERGPLASRCVKVPHHGSTSSLHHGMWAALSIPEVTVAVISADGIQNPRRATVQALLDAGATVLCSNVPQQHDFPVNMKPASIVAWQKYGKLAPEEKHGESHVTVEIDPSGGVVWECRNACEFLDSRAAEFHSSRRSVDGSAAT